MIKSNQRLYLATSFRRYLSSISFPKRRALFYPSSRSTSVAFGWGASGSAWELGYWLSSSDGSWVVSGERDWDIMVGGWTRGDLGGVFCIDRWWTDDTGGVNGTAGEERLYLALRCLNTFWIYRL